jgi:hypothetical protein
MNEEETKRYMDMVTRGAYSISEEDRKEVIPELNRLVARLKEIEREMYYLRQRCLIREVSHSYELVYAAAASLRDASDAIKQFGTDYIRATVNGWYRILHFDMDPLVEIQEKDIEPPAIESITYKGEDTWEVLMTTTTHGRERVVIHSDGASWQQVYSAEAVEDKK